MKNKLTIAVFLRDILYICKIQSARFVLMLCWIFPVKRNRIMFWSMRRGAYYTCGPKYICEYLKKHYSGKYELVWGFEKPEMFNSISDIICLKYGSVKWIYYYITAKVIITDVNLPTYIPKRRQQFIVQTWHGHPYKLLGRARNDMTLRDDWGRKKNINAIDLYVSSSRVFEKIVIKDSYQYQGEIINCGMPRNDILLQSSWRDSTAKEVRERLNLADYVILYAPTFRKEGKGESAIATMPYHEVIDAFKKRTGKTVSFLVRSHYWDKNVKINNNEIVDVSTYPDIQELYCAANVLITDYSSCMWDFSLLGRPCLLYVPDLEEYRDRDRGFYFPIDKWPGIACHDKKDLLHEIENLDEDRSKRIAEKYLQESGSYEQGTAAKQVCDRIIRFIDTNV